MKHTCRALTAIALLTAAGCDRSSVPLSPSPLTVPFAISGIVYTVTSGGRVPLEGATVQTPGAGQATTSSDGMYAIRGQSAAGTLRVTAFKDGYASVAIMIQLGSSSSDMQRDFDLEPLQSAALFGVISETTSTGTAPAEGILVEVLSCDQSAGNCHAFVDRYATTDKNGAFRLSNLYAGKDNFIWLSRNGLFYQDVPPTVDCDFCFRVVTIDGDTRLDILLQTPPR